MIRHVAVAVFVFVSACSATNPTSIPRIVDGRRVNGPYVPPYAYQWFITGAYESARGQHERAEVSYENALSASPDAWLLAELAKERALNGDLESANDARREALKMVRSPTEIALALGDIENARRNYLGAFHYYFLAEQSGASASASKHRIARMLEHFAQPERARAVQGEAQTIPESPIATQGYRSDNETTSHNALAEAEHELAIGNIENARKLLLLLRSTVHVRFLLGQSYAQTGECRTALEWMNSIPYGASDFDKAQATVESCIVSMGNLSLANEIRAARNQTSNSVTDPSTLR
ncbi:MAG: hypothetical protein R3A47_03380 [Polyangiales bacterium]